MKLLIVVDVQNDFITGALGTPEAVKCVPNINKKIRDFKQDNPDGQVCYTKDIHYDDYFETQEGQNLPVKHCIEGSLGEKLACTVIADAPVFNKSSFGSIELAQYIQSRARSGMKIEEITVIGVCTGICVLSNAIILKSLLPNVPIKVDEKCCACVTPESHVTALAALEACQVEIV